MRPDHRVVLADLGILDRLAPYGAMEIGTPPLGLEVTESDIDIACSAPDGPAFAETLLQAYGDHDGFDLKAIEVRGCEATLCRFRHLGWTIEVFGQAIALDLQFGVRHFRIERRLLELLGPAFRDEVRQKRRRGLKTEPAFAAVLGLTGDPYEALLELERLSDRALRAYYPKSG